MQWTETKTTTQNIHYFACDYCGTRLGESVEFDDGWYKTFGDFELKWYTPDGWYHREACVCEECKQKILSEIYDNLEQMGFKKENNDD